MAKIYGQLEKAQLENLASDPTTTAVGYTYFNTTLGVVRSRTAAGWKSLVGSDISTGIIPLTQGGTGQDNTAVTFPASGTIATTSGTQALTNKDIDGGSASNTNRLTIPQNTKTLLDGLTRKAATVVYASDQKKLYVDDGTLLKAVGSGSGQGGINYITNYSAEDNLTGWNTFRNQGASSAVTGTGGTFAGFFLRNTTNPIRNAADFSLQSGGGINWGDGVSYDFTVDLADTARVLSISFENTNSFLDDVIQVWIYDRVNNTLIQPSTPTLKRSTAVQTYSSTFQTAYNSTQYRLILWQSATQGIGALQYTNVKVGPQSVTRGSAITDLTAFTLTSSWTTGATNIGKVARLGNIAYIEATVAVTGAVTNATLHLFLPASLTIDNAAQTDSTVFGQVIGHGGSFKAGGRNFQVLYVGPREVSIVYQSDLGGIQTEVAPTLPVTWAAGDKINVTFTVPILGWSSNTTMSNIDEGRSLACRYYAPAEGVSVPINTAIKWLTKDYDLALNYDPTTGRFTATAPGLYYFTARTYFNATNSIYIWKNGAKLTQGTNGSATQASIVSDLVWLNAGDYVDIRPDGAVTLTLTANTWLHTFSAWKTNSVGTIAASETIAARYTTVSGQSFASGTAAVINFDQKDYDTHGMVTTGASWSFIAPVPDKFRFSLVVIFTNNVGTGERILYYRINGGSNLRIASVPGTTQGYMVLNPTIDLNLKVGDTVQFLALQTSASTTGLAIADATNCISISRAGR